MSDKTQIALSDIVQISRQYQRSIRVDADIGRADALSGYICHATAAAVVDGMSKQLSSTNQRCFTWTGPFGGGKSSLAVALASALHPNKTLSAQERDALNALEEIKNLKASNRKRLGLSAAQFALLIGTTQQSIFGWESGKTQPRAKFLPAIAELRGVGKREVAERLAKLEAPR